MKYARLVWVNLIRNKRRTILTTLSVAAALFLFASLRSVVTALQDAGELGSETRMITRNAISLAFLLPESYYNRLVEVPGVKSVSWAAWFGGVYRDPRDWFASLAIKADSYLPMYHEIIVPEDQKRAFMAERTAALVGSGLMERFGWRLGQTVSLRSTIFAPDQEWPFTVRAVYEPSEPAFGDEWFFFNWEYLYENTGRRMTPGWYVLQIEDPALAASVARAVDEQFESSQARTKTETERAFQTNFLTMWGNVGLLINVIGMAVFFAILLVAANAMMMAARERMGEVAVLKTLGFGDRLLFILVLVEAAAITVGGGLLGVLGAKLFFDGTEFQGAGFLPGFEVKWVTMAIGMAIAVVLGLVAGLLPAWQAARLPVAGTLRRVA
ncbi:MAG: FtsX-like permease family protein [Gemmatimonadales bacterium]|jgi:putative ABC transport system permease protein